MTHGSLFSGIGGFDLAAEWMGWQNVFNCEIGEFPRKILKHHFPNSICYEDIKKTDFTKHKGEIDIISGGFPCQPYSNAGKRKGKEDDRHLWPEMLRVIREIQPCFVVGENVAGLLSWNNGMVFHEIIADLENEGYETQAFLIPACAANAVHRRDRIWFITHANNGSGSWNTIQTRRTELKELFKSSSNVTYTNGTEQGNNITENIGKEGEIRRGEESNVFGKLRCDGNASNTNSTSEQGKYIGQTWEGKFNRPDSGNGFDNFQNFPTQSPICGGNDGLSTKLDDITFPKWRIESIKGYGNAVVPQVVYQIFKAIEQSIL